MITIIVLLGAIFVCFILVIGNLPMNALTFVTFMMAVAMWFTTMLSLNSISQTYDMLKINQRTLEEMRRSRPKPSITAYIEKSTRPAASIPFSRGGRSISRTGETYDLVVKNIGRDFARDIHVLYCISEMPNHKPGKKLKAYDESQLVDSLPIGIDIRPLGPGDEYRVDFDFITDPKIWHIKIIKITYSDGVESYQAGPYRLDTWS
jgi:hypothetical protein